MKTKNATRKRAEGDDLLRTADRVNAIARRAEHLITGCAKARRYLALAEQGKDEHLNQLRAVQALRDVGDADPDFASMVIYRAADEMAEEATGADPKLLKLLDRLKAALKEQGESFDPNKDAWSKELFAVSAGIERGWNETYGRYFISILRGNGEDEIADLYLNDNDAFWRRIEAGLRILLADKPEALAELDEKRAEWDRLEAQAQGDTPTSEVVPKG